MRSEDARAYDVVVRGQVQGVGFRFFARETARRLGVVGAVRNRPDGSVSAHIDGNPDALDRMVDALRKGPLGARVDEVSVEPSTVLSEDEELRIAY